MGKREYSNVPRVYFDMDGVLADYDAAVKEHGTTPKEFKLVPDAYRNLKVLGDAVASVNLICAMGYDCWVLSKLPNQNRLAATEKLDWINIHFPMLNDKVILTPDKGAVGTSQDFLIDDHPEWANANKFRGTVIKFADNWDKVIAYLQEKR